MPHLRHALLRRMGARIDDPSTSAIQRMCGTTARTMFSIVRTLRSHMSSHVASGASWTASPIRKPPARLQSASMRPKRSTAAATEAVTADASRRSVARYSRPASSSP